MKGRYDTLWPVRKSLLRIFFLKIIRLVREATAVEALVAYVSLL
jgi:hypothetical protein